MQVRINHVRFFLEALRFLYGFLANTPLFTDIVDTYIQILIQRSTKHRHLFTVG